MVLGGRALDLLGKFFPRDFLGAGASALCYRLNWLFALKSPLNPEVLCYLFIIAACKTILTTAVTFIIILVPTVSLYLILRGCAILRLLFVRAWRVSILILDNFSTMQEVSKVFWVGAFLLLGFSLNCAQVLGLILCKLLAHFVHLE